MTCSDLGPSLLDPHYPDFELNRYCVQEEYGDINAYYSTKADVPHMWGFQHVMSTWHMGDDFFWQCKKARSPCAGRVESS